MLSLDSGMLKRLRLSHNIAAMRDQVEADTHQEYLLQLLKHELCYREAARKKCPIKQAEF